MTQTIAQQIKWDFKANGSLEIRDKNNELIYLEDSDGFWAKQEWDSQGNPIYIEFSSGGWLKHEYDSEGNVIYFEASDGLWAKQEWDSQGNEIYFENSRGKIIDKRPKPCENKIVEFEGEKFKLVKV